MSTDPECIRLEFIYADHSIGQLCHMRSALETQYARLLPTSVSRLDGLVIQLMDRQLREYAYQRSVAPLQALNIMPASDAIPAGIEVTYLYGDGMEISKRHNTKVTRANTEHYPDYYERVRTIVRHMAESIEAEAEGKEP